MVQQTVEGGEHAAPCLSVSTQVELPGDCLTDRPAADDVQQAAELCYSHA